MRLHTIIRGIVVLILLIMFLLLLQSCSGDEPEPDAPLITYNEIIEILDNTGRSQNVTLYLRKDGFWIITFEKGKQRGKISESTKVMFCTAFPDKCK